MEPTGEVIARLGRVVLQRLEALQRAGVATIKHGDAPLLLETLSVKTASRVESVDQSRPVESRFVMKPSSITTAAPPVPSTQETADMPPRAKPAAVKTTAPVKTSSAPSIATPVSIVSGDRASALAALKCDVEQCTLCKDLAKTRTQTVFGVGNIHPRVVFFGEAPGADEDRTGEPFVGRAGQLLTKIIEACTFKREDVYIMNVLKCRPPDNRTPVDEEIEKCRPHFEKQLAILQPEYIVCAGATPMKALFGTKKSVGQMRGTFHDYHGAKVLITYHPAYLLRNPPAKKFVWDDMKMLLADMGIELPTNS